MCMCQASIPRPSAPRTPQGPPKAASTTGTGTGQGKGGGNVKGSKTYIEQSPGGTSRTRRWRPDYQGQEPPPEIFGQSVPKRHKPSKGKNALIPASGSVTSPPSVDEMELDNVRAELDHTKSSARATQQLLLSLWGTVKNVNDKIRSGLKLYCMKHKRLILVCSCRGKKCLKNQHSSSNLKTNKQNSSRQLQQWSFFEYC